MPLWVRVSLLRVRLWWLTQRQRKGASHRNHTLGMRDECLSYARRVYSDIRMVEVPLYDERAVRPPERDHEHLRDAGEMQFRFSEFLARQTHPLLDGVVRITSALEATLMYACTTAAMSWGHTGVQRVISSHSSAQFRIGMTRSDCWMVLVSRGEKRTPSSAMKRCLKGLPIRLGDDVQFKGIPSLTGS